ncbi:FCD domain-containing protein [Paraburkholderia phymatum]|uniref:GntR family transcriptional regulator n=1 Tax=Paraburkholderia phymatum TaxID=148447 RepID=UPI00317D9AEC
MATKKTQSETVVDGLRADILSCRLAPGTRMRINDFCERFEVSLPAVREALSKLSAQGLVISEPQRGYRVAPVSLEDLEDLTETRIELETLCLARSIARGNIDWETRVVAAMHRLGRTAYRAADDPSRLNDAWAEAHYSLHESLVSACGSERLLRVRSQMYEQGERYRRLSVPLYKHDRDVHSEHTAIAAAALERETDKATALMADHLRMTASILVDGLKELLNNAAIGKDAATIS